jgi:hypothetical protein
MIAQTQSGGGPSISANYCLIDYYTIIQYITVYALEMMISDVYMKYDAAISLGILAYVL